jgi:hypothetical protein
MRIKRVVVFGLGAIGSNLLVQLSKQYPDMMFQGIDFDKVEERNIRTQAYFLEHVGQPKVMAMRSILARFNRKPSYLPVNTKITTKVGIQPKLPEDELYLDCFDNSESRRIIAGSKGNILHIGFSPHYTAECIWNENYDVPNDVDSAAGDICSMTDAVPFIHYVVNSAALSISEWIQSGKKRDFLVTGKSKLKYL